MKLKTIIGNSSNHNQISAMENGRDQWNEKLMLPAATLWVIQPPPPDRMLVRQAMNATHTHRGYHRRDRLLDNSNQNEDFTNAVLVSRNTSDENISEDSAQEEHRETFHAAMRATIVTGQIFALIPVSGVLEDNSENLRFTYFSFRFLYCCISFLGQFFIALMCFYRITQIGVSFHKSTSFVFYASTSLTTLLFTRVAQRWPELVRRTVLVERALPVAERTAIVRKCSLICAIVLVLALIEHILSLLAGIEVARDRGPDLDVYESFFKNSFPWIFDYIPYNWGLGVFTEILNIQSTFNWNFMDLFIISMSCYLTSRFEQINKCVCTAQHQEDAISFWRSQREDFVKVANLVRQVDDTINGVVFLSFANNLYFICLQLFHSLEDGIYEKQPACPKESMGPLGGIEHAVYFTFSSIFLLVRALAVSLHAAHVHSAARVPAVALYQVPTPQFSIEVQRFLNQVNQDSVALTGLRFFNITRGLILTVAGTIVTYELVLVQFNAVSTGEQQMLNCNVVWS